MGNIIMYATECLRTFDESPFNEVDSLILSWLSYLHYPDDCRENGDFRVKDMFRTEMFDSMAHHVWFRKKTLELLTAAAASPRFRDIRIIGFKQEPDADSLTFDAKLLYKSMNRWVDGLNDEDREKFIGEISNMIDKTDTADIMDFCSHWGQNAAVIAKTIFFLSVDTKVFFIKMMYRFWASCCRSLPEVFGKKYLCAVAA